MATKAPAPPAPPTLSRGLNLETDKGQVTVDPKELATDSDMDRLASLVHGETAAEPPKTEPAKETPKAEPRDEEPPTEVEEPKADDLNEGLDDVLGTPKDEEKPAEKDAADKAPEVKKVEPAPEKQTPSAKDMRSQLERFSSENKELKRRLDELTTKAKDDPERKALVEQLSERDKRLQEMEEKLAFLDYSQSPKFKEQYEAPYESSVKEAFKELTTITKTDGTKLAASEIEAMLFGGEREAYRVIQQTVEGADARLAERLVQEVYTQGRLRQRALEQAKTSALSVQKQRQAEMATQRERYKAAFESTRDQLREKFPDLYKPSDADPERNKLLDAGYNLVETAINKRGELSPEQLVRVDAEIYHRAGAFPALRQRAVKAEQRVAQLEKDLAKYRSSAPGPGQATSEDSPRKAEEGTLEGAFETLARMPG